MKSKFLRLIPLLSLTGLTGLATSVYASSFQLWEQDGASVGNYHAGYAALAEDATTAWYNPAGITRIKNQQVVFALNNILTDIKFDGTVRVNTFGDGKDPFVVKAQAGNYSLVPAFHYVAPIICDKLGFGFSVDVPFGLKTNYGRGSEIRYDATVTAVTVVDFSPSLAAQVTEQASVGLGFDIQKMYAEIDTVAGVAAPVADSPSRNNLNDVGYGYHLGVLYQFSPDTRIGLSYHSKVDHHLKGSSMLTGPLPRLIADGPVRTHAHSDITLPAYTALSVYHKPCPKLALMGSIIRTQWNVIKELSLHNVASVSFDGPDSTTITLPEHYSNTWNMSVGADYFVNDCLKLRTGFGYDQTPEQDKYRTPHLPDNNRFVVALGGHYQASKCIGVDLGYSHIFVKQASINPPAQVSGNMKVKPEGHVSGSADVYGAQLVWDII